MDKIFEQIFKAFNLLAREIQIYFFSGVVISANVLLIDNLYFGSTLLTFMRDNNLMIFALIIIYLMGHFCMAFYYTFLIRTGLTKKLDKPFKFNDNWNRKLLPRIYKNNPSIYSHFIDSYYIVTLVRWTVSAACFINFITDGYLLLFCGMYWQLWLAAIIFLIGTIAFYLISSQDETENIEVVESLKDEMNSEKGTTIVTDISENE